MNVVSTVAERFYSVSVDVLLEADCGATNMTVMQLIRHRLAKIGMFLHENFVAHRL